VHKGKNAFGLSLTYLTVGSIKGYDEHANPIGNFTSNDLAFSASYAREVREHILLGATAKWIREKIEKEEATSFAADCGALFAKEPFSFGFVLQNITLKKIRFVEEAYGVCRTIRCGAAYKRGKVLLCVEWVSPEDKSPYFSAGAQIGFGPLSLRAGYRGGPQDVGRKLCAGFGLSSKRWSLDYAYAPFGVLGNAHRVSLNISL
jgi:hypothetical protein